MITNVLEYLEESGRKYPDKIVFEDPAHGITYKECIQNSKKIGTVLARSGKKNQPVAVLIDRDIESLELFMGCVYSGNFYIPISKQLPEGRIVAILELVKPLCLLGQKKDQEFLEKLAHAAKPVYFEDLLMEEADEEQLLRIRKMHLDTDPLYSIFTSGSTGMPKGVLISHKSVIDLVEQFTDVFSFDENEVFGNQAPFDFDVSVKDIYNTIKNGATMCIIPQMMFSMPKLLIPYLNEKKVSTVIWAVTALALISTFRGFKKGVPEHLKKVMFSGEVMPIPVLNYWKEMIPDAMYVNLYGPTEITCNCTYYIVDREFKTTDVLPIGKAFQNTEVFLLNEENKLVEGNETGEICVKGTCLGLGYYKSPEATAKAFCQNPLNADYPERIYRTGDLGRYENGELFYVNRKDFQIKHMGHRIELGEIEACLNGLDYLDRNCCMYDSVHEKIYMFYQAEEACEKRIIQDLQKFLPKYMCPNIYVFLEQLPVSKNGKIDRQLLKEKYILKTEN